MNNLETPSIFFFLSYIFLGIIWRQRNMQYKNLKTT